MLTALFLLCIGSRIGPTMGIIVQAQGTVAKERIDPIFLRCDVTDTGQDYELVSATWCRVDPSSQGNCAEVFRVDLTSEHPAYFFALSWAGRGRFDPGSMANIVLPVHYVTRLFAGMYRCMVQTSLTSAFADVLVNVLYGPGTSILIEPKGRVEKAEGAELILTCEADCRPSCGYRWYVAGRRVASTSVLRMTSLRRDQAGLYACQARNEVGRSIKPVEVRALFPASILSLNLNVSTSATDSTSAGEIGMMRRTDVQLSCKVVGFPAPKVTWMRGLKPVLTGNASSIATTSSWQHDHHVFSLKFPSSSCLENGYYTCSIWNGVGIQQEKTIPVKLNCAPFEVKTSPPCQIEADNQQTDDNDGIAQLERKWGDRVTFHLCFWAFPKPKAFFRRKNTPNRHEAEVTCYNTTSACTTSMSFVLSSGDQYGVYEAEVTNGLKSLVKTYSLTSRQAPRPPQVLDVANLTSSSACVNWKNGFDGGAPQTLVLRLNRHAGRMGRVNIIVGNLSVHLQASEKNANTPVRHSTCLSHLLPSSLYTVIMKSYNIYGESNNSLELSFKTLTDLFLDTTPPTVLNKYPNPDSSASPSSSPSLDVHSSRSSTPSPVPTSTTRDTGELLPWGKHTSIFDYVLPNDRTGGVHGDDANDNRKYETMAIQEDEDDLVHSDDEEYHNYDEDSSSDDTNLIHSLFFLLEKFIQNITALSDTGRSEPGSKPFPLSQPLHADRYLKQYRNLNIKSDYIDIISTNVSVDSIPSTTTTMYTSSPSTRWTHDDNFLKEKTMTRFTSVIISAGIGFLVFVSIAVAAITVICKRKRYQYHQRQNRNIGMPPDSRPSRPSYISDNALSPAKSASYYNRRHFSSVSGMIHNGIDNSPTSRRSRNVSSPSAVQIKDELSAGYSEVLKQLSPIHFRARLSTPDLNFVKSKRKRIPPPSPPPFPDHVIGNVRVPTISVSDVRRSASSYLNVDSSASSGSHDGRDNAGLDYLSPSTTLERSKHLSYTSIPQVTTGEMNPCNSYLDLYEMLSIRSRSRSPSNIYDPLESPTLRNSKEPRHDIREETDWKRDVTPSTSSASLHENYEAISTCTGQSLEKDNNSFEEDTVSRTRYPHYEECQSLTADETLISSERKRLSTGSKLSLSKQLQSSDIESQCNLAIYSNRPYSNTQEVKTDTSTSKKLRNPSGDKNVNSPSTDSVYFIPKGQNSEEENKSHNSESGKYISLRTHSLKDNSKLDNSKFEKAALRPSNYDLLERKTTKDIDTLQTQRPREPCLSGDDVNGHLPLCLRVSEKSQEGSAHHPCPIHVVMDTKSEDGANLVANEATTRDPILERSRKIGDHKHYMDIDPSDDNNDSMTNDVPNLKPAHTSC